MTTDPFSALLGADRGEAQSGPDLHLTFAQPLAETQRAQTQAYVISRLDSARGRCHWPTPDTLHIECGRELTSQLGVVRLHIQKLTGVSVETITEWGRPHHSRSFTRAELYADAG